MTKARIKKKMREYGDWVWWAKRPVAAFVVSLFQESITREYMRKTGVDTEYQASIFQDGVWYESPTVLTFFRKGIEQYMAHGGSILDVVRSCEIFWRKKTVRVLEMQSEPEEKIIDNLVEFKNILNEVNAYVWLTYGFEEMYTEILEREVPKYIAGDPQEFIRAVSIPSKKNTYAQLEDALRGSRALEEIRKEFGWMKSRDGFTNGFRISELAAMRKKIRSNKKERARPLFIPRSLRRLVREVQELVYFRTLRGDARSHLIFLMRPILRKVAKKHHIDFPQLRYYSVYDLILGKPIFYPPQGSFLLYKGEMMYQKNNFFQNQDIRDQEIIGATGFPGKCRGVAKIVTKTADLKKVNEGDILIAQMTFPAFITALHKAAAFVTDEGGITSHAAVIAREMQKPCIVGTRIATRVLHDGDYIEVNANDGTVKKIR